jgi:IMP dehydrogenase
MIEALTYDDLLLVPQYSDILSRREASTESILDEELDLKFKLPIISSPMDTVTGADMAVSIANLGGLGIIHRYNTVSEQTYIAKHVIETVGSKHVGFAIGVTGDYRDRARALVDSGALILCLDVAHGDHVHMKDALTCLRDDFGRSIHLMAGNVATLESFDNLASWGARSIRGGIGGGSICSTRLQTGHGVPSLMTVFECARSESDTKLIADGGIKTPGDIVKALAAGADFVMLGSMLSGTDETPGEIIIDSAGNEHKAYRGMASKDAQIAWRGRAASLEGIATTVRRKGPVADIIANIENGLRSGMSYSGARSLSELRAKARWRRQTGAGTRESDTHILHRA